LDIDSVGQRHNRLPGHTLRSSNEQGQWEGTIGRGGNSLSEVWHDLVWVWVVEETFQDPARGFRDVWSELFSGRWVERVVHELSMFSPVKRGSVELEGA
jgi:hypothetical protein